MAEADMVAGHMMVRGTHQGEFMGIPPTNREARWTETHIGRLENGKFVEHWADIDQLGMMQQLGVIPPPGQGAGQATG